MKVETEGNKGAREWTPQPQNKMGISVYSISLIEATVSLMVIIISVSILRLFFKKPEGKPIRIDDEVFNKIESTDLYGHENQRIHVTIDDVVQVKLNNIHLKGDVVDIRGKLVSIITEEGDLIETTKDDITKIHRKKKHRNPNHVNTQRIEKR